MDEERKYTYKDARDGEILVGIGEYTLFNIYYGTDGCQSPLSKEDAEHIAKKLIGFLEDKYPATELDDDYFEHSEGYEKFMDFMKFMTMMKIMSE